MPAERTTMRQVREVLRLKFVGGVPTREIAGRIGVAASTPFPHCKLKSRVLFAPLNAEEAGATQRTRARLSTIGRNSIASGALCASAGTIDNGTVE
jgi:hypothetical protein